MKKYFIKLLSFILVVVSIMSTSILSFAETDNEIDDFLSSIPQRESSEIGILEFTPDENEEGVLATSIPKQIFLNSGTFAKSKEETVEYIVENEAKNKKEKYSITIAVEQPNQGSYDCVWVDFQDSTGKTVSNHSIGHTFVVLGDHSSNKDMFYSFGFYPKYVIETKDLIRNANAITPGLIFSDKGHSFTQRKTYWVNKETFDKAKKYLFDSAKDMLHEKHRNYDLVNYNCTTFAKEVVDKSGINDTGLLKHNWQIPQYIKNRINKVLLSRFEKNFGYYPGAAGQQLSGK